MLPRFYTPDILKKPCVITLEKEELHHLKSVMRIHSGEKIEIMDGKGAIGVGIFDKDKVTIESVHLFSPPSFKSYLIQALTEKANLELITEKATELGVTHMLFFVGEKSKLRTLSETTLERLKKITIASLKQSGRPFLPEITFQPSLKSLVELHLKLYMGDLQGEPLLDMEKRDSGFIIGPESGFSASEIAFLKHTLKANCVLLSGQTLRAETAAIIASFLVSSVNSKGKMVL